MSRLQVHKVAVVDDRTLPVFAEFDNLIGRIRDRAYELFAGRGASNGHALADWVAAEKEFGWPAAELVETEDSFSLRVALAGFKRRDVMVTANPRELIVKAARRSKRKKRDSRRLAILRWTEFSSHDVCRRVELPCAIDVEAVSARFANGLLKIEAPKATE